MASLRYVPSSLTSVGRPAVPLVLRPPISPEDHQAAADAGDTIVDLAAAQEAQAAAAQAAEEEQANREEEEVARNSWVR